jgi:hypothetical protein
MFFLKWKGQLLFCWMLEFFMLISLRFVFKFFISRQLLISFVRFTATKFLSISNLNWKNVSALCLRKLPRKFPQTLLLTLKYYNFIADIKSTKNPFFSRLWRDNKGNKMPNFITPRVTNRKRYILWFITLFSCKHNLHVRIRWRSSGRKR